MDQLLFDVNPSPVLIYEPESLLILDVNESFLNKYGYNKSEIDQLTIEDIRPPEDIGKLNQVLDNLDEKGTNKTGVVRHRSKGGKLFYVIVNSHEYEYKGKNARLVVIEDVTERIEAEEKLRQTYKELRHHVNLSPLAMIKWDKDFNIIEWSNRARKIIGYAEDEVLGRSVDVINFHTPHDRSVVEQNIEQVLSGELDQSKFNIRIENKKNELVYLRVHGSALRDDEGNLVSVLTFMEDITDEKKTEIKYQRLFENANDGIFLMQGDKFVECNDEVCNIYGCSKNEIIGCSPIDFSPEFQPDGRRSDQKAQEKISSALDGEPQVFEWKHIKKDGTPIDTEVSLNSLELGDDIYVQAIVRDLTEQKKAQEKLRKSEEMFRKLFLKAPGAMIMVDKENRVQMVNQSFEELFGYSQEELMGKDIDQMIVPEGEYKAAPRMPGSNLKEGRFYEDVTRYTKDGTERDLLLGAIPVYLDDEPIAGFGIYIDITEQKEYQRKLKKSLEEKQVLLEEIHHRVKNNLAIISGFLQLQSFEVEDENTKAVLKDTELRIQSIAIVHEMLYQSENFTDISFEAYVNKLVNTMKNTLPFDQEHISIEVNAADVSMDINQAIPCAILINELLTNSYKHAFKGRESGTIWITLKDNDEQITIIFRDDGVGLPEDFSIEKQSSIGMELIQTLTNQLEGTLEIKTGAEGYFRVSFDKKDRNGSSSLHMLTHNEK